MQLKSLATEDSLILDYSRVKVLHGVGSVTRSFIVRDMGIVRNINISITIE